MRRIKVGWWAPWNVTRPWLPYGWLGTDEWHNPAVSINVPLLGAFHIWFGTWRDCTEGHYSLVPDCQVCQALLAEDFEDVSFPQGWWWNPPRPG